MFFYQSTHRMSDATNLLLYKTIEELFPSTHRMCDAPAPNPSWSDIGSISIHAPHERCDFPNALRDVVVGISIHAPHERCDAETHLITLSYIYFNPRTA